MIVIVDYDSGNISSIRNMLHRRSIHATISRSSADILSADALILPGVGAYDTCAANLRRFDLVGPLEEAALARKVPILGICVGAQLMLEGSEEGVLPGLGWIAGRAKRFTFGPGEEALPVPHMGWNEVEPTASGAPLLVGLTPPARFYFVHSYFLQPDDPVHVAAWATYGRRFCAAMVKGNIAAVQFHPEKSHRFGATLYSNFAAIAHAA